MTKLSSRRSIAIMAVATIILAAGVGLGFASWMEPSGNPAPTTPAVPDLTGLMNGRMIGDPSAPVTVVEWGNYK